MLIIFSPTKTMKPVSGDYDNTTAPEFIEEARLLNKSLFELTRQQLSDLMNLSDSLAAENIPRIREWGAASFQSNATPAVLTYDGESFRRLGAEDFSPEQMAFAAMHFRILSGLYGVLRPMDLVLPYRLEMLTPLAIRGRKNLYEYWNAAITANLSNHLIDLTDHMSARTPGSPILINLASTEYSKCVQKKTLGYPVLNIHFKEQRGDKLKVISVFVKQARGLMARYIIKNGITDHHKLKKFKEDGYTFREDLSKEREWVFVRSP